MLQSDSIEQPLIVIVSQNAMAKMLTQLLIELLGSISEFFRSEIAARMPECEPFAQQNLQCGSKLMRPTPLGLQHLRHIAQQVGQALLLCHSGVLFGVVAFAPVADQYPSIVGCMIS